MNSRIEGIRQRFADAVSNEGTIGPQAMKALAVNCCHELLDEYDTLRSMCGKLTAALQDLQEDDLHVLLEGGDAIVDAKSKVRKCWMIVTGLSYDELQEIAPMKPGHEL